MCVVVNIGRCDLDHLIDFKLERNCSGYGCGLNLQLQGKRPITGRYNTVNFIVILKYL